MHFSLSGDVQARRERREKKKEKGNSKRRLAKIILPKPPLRIQIVGRSGAGKTVWLVNELLKPYGRYLFDQIIWVAPRHSLDQQLVREIADIWGEYFSEFDHLDEEGIEEVIAHGEKLKWQTLVVLDDMVSESGSDFVKQLFVSGRIRGVSVFELLQQIFPSDRGGNRQQRLQCDMFVVFDFAAKDEAPRLFNQVTLDRKNAELLVRAYSEILHANRHGCLILDTRSPSTPKLPLRVRDTQLTNFIQALWFV